MPLAWLLACLHMRSVLCHSRCQMVRTTHHSLSSSGWHRSHSLYWQPQVRLTCGGVRASVSAPPANRQTSSVSKWARHPDLEADPVPWGPPAPHRPHHAFLLQVRVRHSGLLIPAPGPGLTHAFTHLGPCACEAGSAGMCRSGWLQAGVESPGQPGAPEPKTLKGTAGGFQGC